MLAGNFPEVLLVCLGLGHVSKSFAILLKIENNRNWFEKKYLDAIQQWKCTEFVCGSFCICCFLRSFFRGKVLEKSSVSLLDGVLGHNGPLGTPGHNGPLGVHWGPHGPHMGPMLDPCWSNMVQHGYHVGPMLFQHGPTWVPCWTHVGPTWSKMVGGRCGLGGGQDKV